MLLSLERPRRLYGRAEMTNIMSLKKIRQLFFLGGWKVRSFIIEKKQMYRNSWQRSPCVQVILKLGKLGEFRGERFTVESGGVRAGAVEGGLCQESSVPGVVPKGRVQGVSPAVLTLVHIGIIWGILILLRPGSHPQKFWCGGRPGHKSFRKLPRDFWSAVMIEKHWIKVRRRNV